MKMQGKAEQLCQELAAQCPEVPQLPAVRRQLLDYQMLALYGLARKFNRAGARILEIGTGHGASGYMLAKAAPLADIVSLTTNPREAELAGELWKRNGISNIEAITQASWDFLASQKRGKWAMVFIDGDHNQIARDMPWYDRLEVGGLLLCHDYSPQDSAHASPIAFAVLEGFREKLGRPFDALIIDDTKTGMAGFYRRSGERWA